MRRRDERRAPVRFRSVRSGPERDSASEGPAARSRGRAERRVEANSPSGHGGRRWRAAGATEASWRRRGGGPARRCGGRGAEARVPASCGVEAELSVWMCVAGSGVSALDFSGVPSCVRILSAVLL